MQPSYDDIMSRIGAPPIWFDEHAVPRYCVFEPRRSASIHIGEIALAEITCQECKRKLHVAFSAVNFGQRSIAEAIRNRTLHYGDPPRHDGLEPSCGAGATMNSAPRRVLEYWRRHDQRHVEGSRITDWKAYSTWVRDPSMEIDIKPEWVRDW